MPTGNYKRTPEHSANIAAAQRERYRKNPAIRERIAAAVSTHGHTSHKGEWSPTYRSWRSMLSRCLYKSQPGWANYGGRGISVCKHWRTFENFLADMGERPDGLTLDRIDPDGNYEPDNCRWATWTEQRRNRRQKN
jgi:hypothetical protein